MSCFFTEMGFINKKVKKIISKKEKKKGRDGNLFYQKFELDDQK